MTGTAKQTYEKLKRKMERPHLVLATAWDILSDGIKNFSAKAIPIRPRLSHCMRCSLLFPFSFNPADSKLHFQLASEYSE